MAKKGACYRRWPQDNIARSIVGKTLSQGFGSCSYRECFLILLILAMETATGDIRAAEFTSGDKGEAPFCPTCWTRSLLPNRSAP